jgi:hypothetical protein
MQISDGISLQLELSAALQILPLYISQAKSILYSNHRLLEWLVQRNDVAFGEHHKLHKPTYLVITQPTSYTPKSSEFYVLYTAFLLHCTLN